MAAKHDEAEGDSPGFTLHFGWIFFYLVPSLVLLLGFGLRRFWVVPVYIVAIVAFFQLLALWESRWGAVTPEHTARGAPATCRSCGEELLIVARRRRFKVLCPICGRSEKGALRS